MGEAERAIEGVVFDVDRFAVHDGPGLRTTVFLKGCPLRCRWCHSPDPIRPTPQLIFREGRCVRCGRCVAACPREAQELLVREAGEQESQPDSSVREVGARVAERRVLWERCDDCGRCVEVCLGRALAIWGRRATAGEIVDVVLRQRPFYRQSGGGVTLSGGEPTYQLPFALAVLRGCHEQGVHTALETCGAAGWSAYEGLLPYVDLFLFDLKHMDPARHREYTGVSNERILESFVRLVGAGAEVIARLPLIPGHNDDEANVVATAGFVRSAGGKIISLLPYNAASGDRYAWIGWTYLLDGLTPQTPERLAGLKEVVRAQGLEARIGF